MEAQRSTRSKRTWWWWWGVVGNENNRKWLSVLTAWRWLTCIWGDWWHKRMGLCTQQACNLVLESCWLQASREL
jgi:hypothetical protein